MKKIFGLLLMLLATAQAASAAAPTVLSGQAHNGSTGKALANATVQLIRPRDANQRDVVGTTRTNAQGRFAFPAKAYDDSELLMANVNRGGFDYWTVAWDGGQKLKSVGITVKPSKLDLLVFDTTTQPVPLDFQVHHLAISSTANGLKCIERIVVENPGKSTFMGFGPRKISVLLNLPKGAKNVALDKKITDARLEQTKDGWGVVKPITPDAYGVRNAIIINYDMPWPSVLPWKRQIDLSREVGYPTKFFFVARTSEDKALQISTKLLGPDTEAPVPIDGKTETRIINSVGGPMQPTPSLEAGKQLDISASRPVSGIFWGFAGLTVAICLFFPLALMRPRRTKGAYGVKSSEPSAAGSVLVPTSSHGAAEVAQSILNFGFGTGFALTDANQELIRKIADLDDLHDSGGITETDYQSQRAAWKKLLLESLSSTSH